MNYYEKYMKYKNKYLNYKKLLGGANKYEYSNIEWEPKYSINNNNNNIISYTGKIKGKIKYNNDEEKILDMSNVSIFGKKYDNNNFIGTVEDNSSLKPIFKNLKWSNSNWSKTGEITTDIEEMTWADKIQNWENGVPQKYPKKISDNFMWEDLNCDKDMKNKYTEKFKISKSLPNIQDYNKYREHIDGKENENAISFNSKSSLKTLIIPGPRDKKNFATIKYFIDEASDEQQVEYWKFVAKEIKRLLQDEDVKYLKIYTLGLDVPYFHLHILQVKY